MLRKYWFSVSDEEQQRRFESRLKDPMRRWKLSPMDLESITRWEEYSRAKDEMMVHTDIPEAPWFVVESDNKKAARLNVINHLLTSMPLRGRDGTAAEAAGSAVVARLHAPTEGHPDPRSRLRFHPAQLACVV